MYSQTICYSCGRNIETDKMQCKDCRVSFCRYCSSLTGQVCSMCSHQLEPEEPQQDIDCPDIFACISKPREERCFDKFQDVP
jgi:hypothetical protein